VLFLLFASLSYYLSRKNNRLPIRNLSLNLVFLLFFIWVFLSLLWTASFPATVKQIFLFSSYLLGFFLVSNIFRNSETKEAIIVVLLLSAFIVSLFAIYQYYWGLEQTREYVALHKNEFNLPPEFLVRLDTNRAFSTFIYPNVLASFLIMLFPLSVYYPLFKKEKRIGFIFIPPVILFAFVLTFSKGGLVAFLLSWTVIGLIMLQKKYKILLLGAILLIFTAALVYSEVRPQNTLVKAFKGSAQVRIEYWQAGGQMLKERPLLGFGGGSFGRVYAKYKLPQAEETQMAHNNFVQVAAETGLIGFSLFLLFLFLYFKAMQNKIRRLSEFSPLQKVLVLGGYTGVLAFLFHSLSDFSLYMFNAGFNLFLLMGLSLVPTQKEEKYSEESRRKGILYFVITLLLSLSAIFLISKALLATNRLQQSLKDSRQNNLPTASKEMKLALRYWRWGEDEYYRNYHYLLSHIYKQRLFTQKIDLTEEISRQLELATELDPYRSFYWRELAEVTWFRKENSQAIKYVQKAISCYPYKGLNYLLLGDIYQSMGEKEKALESYRTALRVSQSRPEHPDTKLTQKEVEKRIKRLNLPPSP